MELQFYYTLMAGAGILLSVRLISRYIRVPEPLLFMIVGAGFAATGVMNKDNHTLEALSMVAITLVMFHTGLGESSVSEFFRSVVKNMRVAVVAAMGPWIGAFVAVNFILGLTMQEAVVAGAVFTATALPFTLGLLRSRRLISSPAAKSAIAAATTDDVLASLVGTFTAILLAAAAGGGESASASAVAMEVGSKVGMVLLFFGLIFLLSWLIDPKPHRDGFVDLHNFTRIFYEHGITPSFIILILAVVIFFGEVVFHVHYAISALMVGILFKRDLFYNTEKCREDRHAPTFDNFEATLHPIVHNIEPFFFLYLGLHLDVTLLTPAAIWAGFVIFALVAVMQYISAYSSGRWVGLDHANGKLLGVCMMPRDVIAFVVLSINADALPDDSVLFLACIMAIGLLNLATTVGLLLFKPGDDAPDEAHGH
ncbi:cation:proton antiporter [Magnetofaba australis]|uniref:Putative proton/sodium antiporter n=1 Tax=Magnetofaba australis IT-1 TaxID=1434232 RepID=A0A1Y2K1K1_9PROT|nr:cation:proton antiporter [Magnetofaba australis]OSM01506.1 putative proton/sodium antiporter [Magnetofaba australis IT-1]